LEPNHQLVTLTTPQTKLEEITLNAQQDLSNFAQGDNLDSVLETAFATPQAPLLAHSLRTGEFLDRLDLEIRPADELEGALGAYASANDTVYLARSLLREGTVEQATDVLLEEVGHAIDDVLNETDTPGDEGAIFASLVQGNDLSSSQLAQRRAENDRAALTIEGETVQVEQATLTVDDDGGGDFTTITDAIAAASAGDTIVVTGGADNIQNETAITVDKAVTIQGDGNATVKGDSSEDVFEIDDGDNSNDISVTIDGLTITGESVSFGTGTGIVNNENLTINESTISDNEESGISNDENLTIRGSTISDNEESGISNGNDGNLTIRGSTISGNFENFRGAGISNSGTVNIRNSNISDNSAFYSGFGVEVAEGGGISNYEGGTLTISNSTVSDNGADSGGGIKNDAGGVVVVSNSTISTNSSDFGAGGINNSGTVSFRNSSLSGNLTDDDGGGIWNNGSSIVSLKNSTLSGNSAGQDGGGIYSEGRLELNNSIIANSVSGGDVKGKGDIFSNGINLVEDGSVNSALTLDPKLSPLQDNGGPTLTQAPASDSPAINLGDNAVIPSDAFDLDNDGNRNEPVPFDQRGNGFSRIIDGEVDLGAVEFQDNPPANPITVPGQQPTLTVDTAVDENDFDLSAGDISLREALAFVEPGGTIDFDPDLAGETIVLNSRLTVDKSLTVQGLGNEQLTIDGNGQNSVFWINDGNENQLAEVAIEGLKIANGTAKFGGGIFNQENLSLNNTTISGNSAVEEGGGIYSNGTVSVNNTSLSNNSAFGEDFSSGGGIENANGTLNISNSVVSSNASEFGGGIDNNGTLSINNSTLSDNSASNSGGGINSGFGQLTLSNSTVSGNFADFQGGGLDTNDEEATIIKSSIADNSADNRGGGIINDDGNIKILNSTISGNATLSSSDGGGFYNYDFSTATVINTAISGNFASDDGGGIYNVGTLNLSNSTISGNFSDDRGGGIFNWFGEEVTLTNSIISGNEASSSGNEIYNYSSTITADANNLFGDSSQSNREAFTHFSPGSNDINATSDGINTPLGNILAVNNGDPVLQDNGGPTKTIAVAADSPALNAGDNNEIPADVADLDGDGNTSEDVPFDQRGQGFDRIINNTVDIGAVEVQQATQVQQDDLILRRGNQYLVDSDLDGGIADSVFSFGTSNEDQYLVGDLSGDGQDDLILRRGNQYLVDSDLDGGIADSVFSFGTSNEDQYLVGDLSGDGQDDLILRRGNQYLVDSDLDGGIADSVFSFGTSNEDQYLVGDLSGDGQDDLILRRGNQYFVDSDLDGGAADSVFSFGTSNADQYLVADLSGDGRDDLITRQGNTFSVDSDLDGTTNNTYSFGTSNEDQYLIGDLIV